ncbi:uncharacterized protein LOC144579777 [Callithrix jacchus]
MLEPGDGQSRRAEVAPTGAQRADLGRRKDRAAREGTGRGGWVWGAGARPGTAAEGKWGCRRRIGWEQRESTVLGAQSGGQACLDQSGRRMGGGLSCRLQPQWTPSVEGNPGNPGVRGVPTSKGSISEASLRGSAVHSTAPCREI